ncbi:PREDICTED: uncharacterized protein LOC104801319 [Tarenaya hassleriana]|uniref:uncharacterized protein LOC104801319 n=1 Tax=Tarenaya hassleriana TaxID=28532 RepID=UPI00053C2408|nr:PREDICTED: uncharacterized protein LOC104801319 [Tarenaya hassleriana]
MSAAAIVSLSNPNDHVARIVCRKRLFHCRNTLPCFGHSSVSSSPVTSLASRFSLRLLPNKPFNSTVFKRSTTVMEWQECKVRKVVGVPISVAYELYSDRESIPRWMTFISSVEVLKDKPDQSRWALKYKAFGQNIEYSWLARNLQPIRNQKIHWISLEGLPNKGTVRFFPRGPSSCEVELTFAYEVPLLLVPFASALQPLMQGMIRQSLEIFAEIAKSTATKTP